MEIIINKRKYTIDKDSLLYFSKYKLHICDKTPCFLISKNKYKSVSNVILDLPKNSKVRHINKNRFDFRKENLEKLALGGECDYKIIGDIAEICLPCGKKTIIDSDKINIVKGFRWVSTFSNRSGFYVKANRRSFDGKHIKLHRLLLRPKDNEEIDHRDGNGLNNRLSNLRICNRKQNCHNMRKIYGKIKYKGVSTMKNSPKYRSYINPNKKQIHLGCFNTPEEAAIAYDNAAIKYFGGFAYLNFPDSAK